MISIRGFFFSFVFIRLVSFQCDFFREKKKTKENKNIERVKTHKFICPETMRLRDSESEREGGIKVECKQNQEGESSNIK